MPPWVACVPRATGTLRRTAIGRLPYSLKCNNVVAPKLSKLHLRYASAHVSPTAINLRPNIPQRNEELHNALSELGASAEEYVNISRLQLALRGLEAQDPVARIAVLSLGSQVNAQRLARLLLADPLGNVAHWEQELERPDLQYEGAVLLRYGDESDAHPPTPLYRVISVPSRILRTHNLEILISTLNTDVSNAPSTTAIESSQDAVLVPKLQATSARGLPVPYPVHKTLVVGQGLDAAISYGRFTADMPSDASKMVKVAIDLPAPMEPTESEAANPSSTVSVDVGIKALSIFRESIANSVQFERGWFRSGMHNLSQWLVGDLHPSEAIKPAMKALISSVAEEAEMKITKADTLTVQHLNEELAQQQTSASIMGHLENWAEQSHTELRDQLDAAFSAKNWHKLSWWKLFWRVDDVSMITSEILERRWLVDAEKGGVFLAGRMDQAGFPEIVPNGPSPLVSGDTTSSQPPEDSETVPPPPLEAAQQPTDISTQVHTPEPWHTQISTSRMALLAESIPPLQALAQRLVLTTLSTTSLSSALSALLYISMPSLSLFEAGAIAALGLVYSLRRMQKHWENARAMWQIEVREEGRKTLKFTEEMVRWIVAARKQVKPEESERVQGLRRAREAVEKVRSALEKMK